MTDDSWIVLGIVVYVVVAGVGAYLTGRCYSGDGPAISFLWVGWPLIAALAAPVVAAGVVLWPLQIAIIQLAVWGEDRKIKKERLKAGPPPIRIVRDDP